MKDLYAILGVPENADEDAIKKAYRKLAKENHPDITGNDKKKTEHFKEINEAYSILGEDAKRKEYDRLRHAPVGSDGMPQGFDPESFAQAFGGRGGPGGFSFQGDMGDLGDVFASLFGGGAQEAGGGGGAGGSRNPWARGRTSRTPRGSNMLGELELTFAEAALGARKTIRTGAGGSVEVNVPAGVEPGGRLRVPGAGGAAPAKGTAGDLLLDLVIKPDPFLRREDDDIVLDVPVTLAEAALGAKIDVPTVDGSVRVTIPPGTSSGAKLRLRGQGIKGIKTDGARGDQICRIQVVVPKIDPDDEETRKLIEDLDRRTKTRVRKF